MAVRLPGDSQIKIYKEIQNINDNKRDIESENSDSTQIVRIMLPAYVQTIQRIFKSPWS